MLLTLCSSLASWDTKQRGLNVLQLSGNHVFGPQPENPGDQKKGLTMDWILSGALANVQTPDLRFFNNDYTLRSNGDTIYDIQANLYPAPIRVFRELDEGNADLRVNFEAPFNQWNQLGGSINFGGAFNYKDRTFSENRYRYELRVPYTNNPQEYFAPPNIGISGTDTVGSTVVYNFANYLQDASEDRNNYTSDQIIGAAYLMTVLPLTSRIKLTVGARYEYTRIETLSGEGGFYVVKPSHGRVRNLSEDLLPWSSMTFCPVLP